MRLMSPDQCAAEGLAALQMHRATHIAGRMNRTVAAVVPRSVVGSMFGKMMHQVVEKRSGSARSAADRGNARQTSRTR